MATGAISASCQPAAPAAPAPAKPAEKVEEEPKKEAKPAEKVKLRYTDWGGERYPKSWQEVGPQSLEDHPEIEISYEPRPDLWIEVITAEYAAGTGSDLFGHCCDHAKTFWEAGQIKDIKLYVDRDIPAEELKDFFESQLTFWTDKGTGALMAATIMSLMPTLIPFFLAQRTFIQGIVITGVEGCGNQLSTVSLETDSGSSETRARTSEHR